MWKTVVVTFGVSLWLASALLAEDSMQSGGDVDTDLAEAGEELYEQRCAACHLGSGRGTFDFPRLNRNPMVENLERVVTQIRRGSGAMPAFPDLDAEQVAALATHLRTAWNNDFGGVQVEQVAAILDNLSDVSDRVSIWEGVYTREQAENGERIFVGRCAGCHGPEGDSTDTDPDLPAGPPVAGSSFLAKWDGQSAYTLFAYARLRMPTINPGSLSDEEYAATVAFMLRNSDVPPGDEPLPATHAGLENILIETEPD